MQIWHEEWLRAHPHRTREWLSDRLRDGFDVHHLDGDKANNAASNLVLIECVDHLGLHGGRALRRLGPVGHRGKRGPQKRPAGGVDRAHLIAVEKRLAVALGSLKLEAQRADRAERETNRLRRLPSVSVVADSDASTSRPRPGDSEAWRQYFSDHNLL